MIAEMATKGQVGLLETLESQKPTQAKAAKKSFGVDYWKELTKEDAARAIDQLKDGSKAPEKTGPPALPEEFRALDLRDEEQILAEMQGRVMDEYAYRFPSGGREVVGLSWVGVKAVARRMGNISIVKTDISDDDGSYRVVVCAEDRVRNVQMMGAAEQAKVMVVRGEKVPDLFALQKALSKAQRNAIRNLIPEEIIKAMLAEYLKKGA